MSEVAGTVVAIRDGRAIVECGAELSGCTACRGGRGCSWRRLVGTRSLAVPAANPSGDFEVGDAVRLAVDDAKLLAAAARLYLPPLAGLLLAPAVLRAVATDAGVASLAAAGTGLLGGLLVARRWASHAPTVTVVRSTGADRPNPVAGRTEPRHAS